jgi:hypothetical protein
MLGQLEAFEKLKPGLNQVIQDWMDGICETEEWSSLSIWVGDNLAALMSSSALSVLAGIVDVQNYLRREKMLDE